MGESVSEVMVGTHSYQAYCKEAELTNYIKKLNNCGWGIGKRQEWCNTKATE